MSSDSVWQAVTTSAVLGTQRRPVQFPATDSALHQLLDEIQRAGEQRAENGPEDVLLGALTAAAIHRRAGRLPQAGIPRRFPACPEEPWPRCTPRAVVFLQAILAGQQRGLLPEWIELAAAHQQRIPEGYVEILFTQKRILQRCRKAFYLALSERGRWIMRQISDLYGKPPPLGCGLRSSEAIWHEGSAVQRAEFLSDLRLHDPRRALELLTESWQQEDPAAKIRLLKVLGETLSASDEPFLESALGGRSQEVRAAAAGLLARLPESQLVARMTGHALQMLTWKTGLLRGTLDARPPQECSAELQRDGIDPRPPQGSLLGQRAGLLAQIVGLVPPGVWSAAWNRRPAQILDAARKTEWEEALLWGWETAAKRLQDGEWLEALIAYHTRHGEQARLGELFARLPEEAQEQRVIGLLRDSPSLSFDQPPSIYLSACRHPWSPELTQVVISAICWTLQKGELPPWHWEKLLRDIPPHFHPDLLEAGAARIADVLKRRPTQDPYAAALAAALRFRFEMRQSFDDPQPRA